METFQTVNIEDSSISLPGSNEDIDLRVPVKFEDSDKFKFELNLSLAFPCYLKAPTNEVERGKEHKTLVSMADPEGNVFMLNVNTKPLDVKLGPLIGRDYDVLGVLLTLAWEQRNRPEAKNPASFKVFYTYSEIAKRLKLSTNGISNIKESMNRLGNQSIVFENFTYKSDTGQFKRNKRKTSIIKEMGEEDSGDLNQGSDGITSLKYVVFDPFIIQNIFDDYVSQIRSETYLDLKSGVERRFLSFLNAKRKVFGNEFIVSLKELADIIVKPCNTKTREHINSYLKRIQKKLNNFSFKIKKVSCAKNQWDIVFKFETLSQIENKRDKFYLALEECFSEASLKNLKIREIDIKNIKHELLLKYKKAKNSMTYTFHEDKIDPSEFAIDLALFQTIILGYEMKSFKGLVFAIMEKIICDEVSIPDGYGHFIYTRVKEVQKKAEEDLVLKMRLEREKRESDQAKNMEKAFRSVFDKLSNDKKFMNNLKDRAKKEVDIDEDNLTYNLMLQKTMESIARREWENGELIQHVAVDKEFSKMNDNTRSLLSH